MFLIYNQEIKLGKISFEWNEFGYYLSEDIINNFGNKYLRLKKRTLVGKNLECQI